jgi:hypothetical protein
MCSGCWKWLSLFGSRAIVERCRREFKKNFLCSLGNYLKLVMHVRSILEMTGCCLHLLKFFLFAQQATDWFIQEREKFQDLHYLLSRSPNKDLVVFHCNKLLLVQLSFGNRNLTYIFGALHCSLYLENPTTLPSDIRQNYLFIHTKSAVWFHLTRAESQAAMMVGIPEGFDTGLFEIRQGWCCGWHN